MRAVGLLFMCSLCNASDLNGADNTLVELVKQNLRRNNDDYADANHNVIETTTTIKNKTTNARRVLFIQVSRDKYHKKQTVTTETVKTEKAINDSIATIENNKATPSYRLKAGIKEANATKAKNKQAKKGARNKVETFEKYIRKNKNIFKDFESKKSEQMQNIMRQSSIPAVNKTKLDSINASYNLTPLRQLVQRQKIKVERNGEMPEQSLPDVNLLDMAPAKGARMENKRLQGRLCDRNVLVPEGPKYDGRGRGYRAGRPPPHTPPPSLLLPRCCNCCKKSVLGCE